MVMRSANSQGGNVYNSILLQIRLLPQRLYGSSAGFSLERQLLLWMLQCSVILSWGIAINNSLLGIPSVWIPLSTGIGCLISYGLVRRSLYWIEKLTWIPIVAYLLIATDSWFTNAGIIGSVPFFLSCIILTTMALFNGKVRLLVLSILILHTTLLIVIQWYVPALVQPYISEEIRWIDLWVSGTFAALYCIGCITIVTDHLERRRRQVEGLLLNVLPQSVAETLHYQYNGEQIICRELCSCIRHVYQCC